MADDLTVAVDPGATSGWAVFVDGRFLASGAVAEVTPRAAYDVLRYYQRQHPGARRRLVVEDQFLWHGSKGDSDAAGAGNRFRSVARVVQVRAWWEAVGDLCGYERSLHLSQCWQGPSGIVALARERFGGNRKQAARWLAEDLFGGKMGKDEADAVLLGRWYEMERTGRDPRVQVDLGALLEQAGDVRRRR